MNIREQAQKRPTERMPDWGFRLMSLTFDLVDWVRPTIDRRVTTFGIREGMTVVDYGCGPGRPTQNLYRPRHRPIDANHPFFVRSAHVPVPQGTQKDQRPNHSL